MLNNEQDVGVNCDGHTSRDHTNDDLLEKNKQEKENVKAAFTTLEKTHAMFTGIRNMGKENSNPMTENSSSYNNNSSIQCG